MKKVFGVIGGDRRQYELAELLRRDGREVFTYGIGEQMPASHALGAEVVVLPLPLERADGILNCLGEEMTLEALFASLTPGQRILAGQVKPEHREAAEKYGLVLEDYFLREELTVANAAITAECALQTAMEHLDRTLLRAECLVTGFGRIGKLLCRRLEGLGSRVTAAARKPEDLAWIRAYGYRAQRLSDLKGNFGSFDVVFNTVPAMVLGEEAVRELSPWCLCVDLASVSGIDAKAAEARGLPCIWARGLPGKMAPRQAAEAIRDTIYMILSE